MDVLYIVMPAYNEAENIRQVVESWYPVIERHSGGGASCLCVANDGSKDDTLNVLLELSRTYPKLVVFDQPNKGHGATLYRLYQYALDAGADYVFQTDSDGQTCPEEFEMFWELRGQTDAIIGNRSHREDGFSRVIVTKTLKLVLFLIFGMSVTDANTPFRLMKREALRKHLPEVPEDFYLSNVLLTILFLWHHERVRFLPITFRQRQGGTNSIHLSHISRIGMRATKDFYKIR